MSSNEEDSYRLQQTSHPINERSNLSEQHLTKYETWKSQAGMAQIKLEYIRNPIQIIRQKVLFLKIYRF
jgi:hypothetical protein